MKARTEHETTIKIFFYYVSKETTYLFDITNFFVLKKIEKYKLKALQTLTN